METTHASKQEQGKHPDTTSQPEENQQIASPLALFQNPTFPLRPQNILQFQRVIGNRATIRLIAGGRRIQREVGLMDPGQREAYTQDTLRRVEPQWEALTPEGRLEMIMSAVNTRLGQIGVPGCGWEFSTSMAENHAARFFDSNWRIIANRIWFDYEGPSQLEPSTIIAKIYHEARHAEQFYRAVRHAVVVGHAAHDVVRFEHVRELVGNGIAAGVINHALADYSVPSAEEEALGRRMYETLYGEDASATQAVYDRLHEAIRRLQAARAARDTAGMAAAEADFYRAHAEYERLPNEADAHHVEELIERDYRRMRALQDATAGSGGSAAT